MASLQVTHKRVQSIRADGELRRTNSSDNMADGSPRILARQAVRSQQTLPNAWHCTLNGLANCSSIRPCMLKGYWDTPGYAAAMIC